MCRMRVCCVKAGEERPLAKRLLRSLPILRCYDCRVPATYFQKGHKCYWPYWPCWNLKKTNQNAIRLQDGRFSVTIPELHCNTIRSFKEQCWARGCSSKPPSRSFGYWWAKRSHFKFHPAFLAVSKPYNAQVILYSCTNIHPGSQILKYFYT